MLACFHTSPTFDTPVYEKGHLRPHFLGLRVVTENAPERATLEKYHAAYARTIMKTVSFDINYEGPSIHAHTRNKNS
jgi:hypothetical protein